MKPTPPDWPRLSSSAYYRDAARMIDWLCAAFGFQLRLKVDGDEGRIEHSELTYGDAVLMVGSERRGTRWGVDMLSPLSLEGANTQGLMLYVDDVDAHCARARGAGAHIVDEPAVHDYGEDYWADRSYGALDPEGHLWWFSQRLRSKPS
ncbi:MAG TPA: VOC family protein [Burkholderiaceae bacterium]|nr:VOC family protein [Burkholderiaceae bacterium]